MSRVDFGRLTVILSSPNLYPYSYIPSSGIFVASEISKSSGGIPDGLCNE